MFNFLKKKNKNENKEAEKNTELLSKTASLLIHAAKMDQKYSDEEKKIIRKTMIELGCEDNSIDEMLIIAEKNESCLLYTSPSPRDTNPSRMPSSA